MYEYHADLIRIHDGDTISVMLDLGVETYRKMTLRLYGIDAPELPTSAGDLALRYAAQWFADNPGPYVVRTIKDRKEKYGRYLATVLCPRTARTLNTDLLSSGNAAPYLGGSRA